MVSMASRRRMSAAIVFSTRCFCSVTSTAMPIRCRPGSPAWLHQFATGAQPHPVTVGMAHAESVIDGGGVGFGEFGGEIVEQQVVGVGQRADVVERQQVVFGLQPEDIEHRLRPVDAPARRGPNPTSRNGRG